MDIPKKQIAVSSLCCAIGAVGYHAYLKYVKKSLYPVNVVKYVFFNLSGEPLSLTDREISDIKQKYEDGVLLSAIAQAHNMSVIMLTRIINFSKKI